MVMDESTNNASNLDIQTPRQLRIRPPPRSETTANNVGNYCIEQMDGFSPTLDTPFTSVKKTLNDSSRPKQKPTIIKILNEITVADHDMDNTPENTSQKI